MVKEIRRISYNCERQGCSRTFYEPVPLTDILEAEFTMLSARIHEDNDSAHLRVKPIQDKWGVILLTLEGNKIVEQGMEYHSAYELVDQLYAHSRGLSHSTDQKISYGEEN